MPLSTDAKEHLRTVSLHAPQVKFLEMLAARGGEIAWDWSKVKPEAKAMLADLINKGLILDREYVTHARQAVGRLVMRLTDQGRQIAEQLEKMAIDLARTMDPPKSSP